MAHASKLFFFPSRRYKNRNFFSTRVSAANSCQVPLLIRLLERWIKPLRLAEGWRKGADPVEEDRLGRSPMAT